MSAPRIIRPWTVETPKRAQPPRDVRRLNAWQIGSRIIAAVIVAALWFGAGALYERRKTAKQAPQPRVRFHVSELEQKPPTGRATQMRAETEAWL